MRDEVWFKHDARSRIDPKMSLLIKYEGMTGYGVFWALIETLHYQNDHEIDLESELPGVAHQLQIDEETLLRIINSIVKCGLFRLENGKVFQSRLKQDQAERSKKNSASSASKCFAGKIGGLVSGASRRGVKGKQLQAYRSKLEADASLLQANEPEERDKREENTNTSEAAPTERVLEIHPSPKAPKSLTRKREELLPYPEDDGPVWLTASEYQAFVDRWGEEETNHLVSCLKRWAAENPKKFKQRVDHSATLVNWRNRRVADGMEFYYHPQHGPNYWKRKDVEQWKTEN